MAKLPIALEHDDPQLKPLGLLVTLPVPLLGLWMLVVFIIATQHARPLVFFGLACGVNRRHLAWVLAKTWGACALFVGVSLGAWEQADSARTPLSVTRLGLKGGWLADTLLLVCVLALAAAAGGLVALLTASVAERWQGVLGLSLVAVVLIGGALMPGLAHAGLTTTAYIAMVASLACGLALLTGGLVLRIEAH